MFARIHFRYALRGAPESPEDDITSHVEKGLGHEGGERLLYEAIDAVKHIVQVSQVQVVVQLLGQHLYAGGGIGRV